MECAHADRGNYLQAKISENPSCLPICLAVRTAVKKESSLTVFDFCRATVIVRPNGSFSSSYFSPYLTSN